MEYVRTYEVTDDLTVKPFCIVSILSRLKDHKIPVSDVEEVKRVKKGLNIVMASTSALSDALLTQITPNKRVKREAIKIEV